MLEQTVRLERRLGRKRWRRGGRKGAPRVRKPPGRKRKLERSVQREPTVLQLPLQRRRGRSVQVGLILGSEQLWRLFFFRDNKGISSVSFDFEPRSSFVQFVQSLTRQSGGVIDVARFLL